MGTVVDAMGTWFEMGAIVVTDEWQTLPESCINGDTFRIKYGINWTEWEQEKGRRIRLLMRFLWFVSTGDVTSKALWLYPDPNKTLLVEPTPPDLVEAGYVVRDLQFKRLRSKYPPISNPEPIPCTVSAEYQ